MYELPGTDSRVRTLIELLSALLALCRLYFRSLHRPAWRDQAAVGMSRGEMEHVKRPIGGNLAPAPSVAQDRSTASHQMTISNAVRNRPVPVLYGLMLISLAGLMRLPPLLQNQGYHGFADQRTLFGIPNFYSNLPFIAVGAAGLFRLRRDSVRRRSFFRDIFDWLWLILLPLESE
jgi:hypothetical protein